MKKRLSGCLVLISVMVAVLLSAGSPAFASGYDVNANLKTGDVYNAHFETVIDQTWTWDGATEKFPTVEKLNMLLTVQNIDQDHNATIQCKLTAIPPSEPPNDNDLLGEMNRLLVGKSFYVKVGPDGNVFETTGIGALLDQLSDGGTASRAEKQASKMSLQLDLEDDIKRLFATLGGHFPQKSVQVGDTWDDTASIRMSVPLITFKRNWKIVSDKDGILTVEGKGNVSVSNSIGATAAKVNWEDEVEETLHMHKDLLFVQTGTWTEHVKQTEEEQNQNQGQTVKLLMTSESKMTFEITKQ